MTPEQRFDRVERVLVRLAKSGREARSEFREKINILIDTQIRNEAVWRARSEAINEQIEAINEQIKGLADSHVMAEKEMVDLRRSQKLTDQALRAFINSLRKGRNGKS